MLGRFVAADGPILLGLADIPGFFAAWCFFLMLRVFDEHKDYDLDLANHPERVLQSGLVTLTHLKVVGAVAIAVQVGVSLWLDRGFGAVTVTWLVVMGWSTLMAKEFFCGAWLEKRLLLYALSHMVVMPMALIWLVQMGAGGEPLPLWVGWLALLSFCSGAAFEVTRKTRGPEEERDGVDSYTKVMGTGLAPLVILGFLVLSTVVLAVLLRQVLGAVAGYWYLLLGVSLALPAVTLLQFRAKPSAKGRKKNEGTVALAMLMGYAILIAALWVARGVA
jgi:4-hydroxybenzoate polyprenyltransferase